MTVDVVLPIPLDRAFTYRVPDDLCAETAVGRRVVVPLGRRMMTGYVVEVGEKEGDLKTISDVLDESPALDEEMLSLTRWIASYYLCSWGEAIRAALPSGLEIHSAQRLYAVAETTGELVDVDGRLISFLLEHSGITIRQLQRVFGSDATMARLRRLQHGNWLRMETSLERPKVSIRFAKFVSLHPEHLDTNAESLVGLAKGHRQAAIIEALLETKSAGEPAVRQSDLLSETSAPASSVKSLVARGILTTSERETIRTPLGELVVDQLAGKPPELHPGQREALSAILKAVSDGQFRPFLLHGITGSGKTEVYIRALEEVLARGKTGIVLVPEIALTPQTVHRFRSRLGDTVEVMHSRMSSGERYDVWRLLQSGRARVAIGPRSAILAPLSNIGLIIVDEEHETSYKQFDPAPRYNARDVAVLRARLNNAVCILGSATPSLESFRNAQIGKYQLLEMPDRVPVADSVATLPTVKTVDLGLEQRKHRLDGNLALELREAIAERLENDEQTILLQNRRGYAGILECRECGWTPQCKDCAVTMTVHKRSRHLRCHYCGKASRIPAHCPDCSSNQLAPHGVGTQRVEEELEELFPDARILRMDLDTTRSKDAHRKILDQFRRGKADILVGTQMVAKGLDFERVTLVGVVNADTGLLFPDFRSAERSFQMLTQVAGRAGRNELPGEVILQTRNPEHPVIRLASAHDYAGFASTEMPERKRLNYPPYGRLIGVEFRGEEEKEVTRLASEWTLRLKSELPGPAYLGPEPAFIARVKRQYRYQTLIKLTARTAPDVVKQKIVQINSAMGRPAGGMRIAVDVDPYGLF